MKYTKKNIYQHLGQVIDPELNIDIVRMGLVYDVVVVGSKVKITMTLTTPGCPLAGVFDPMIRQALSKIDGLDVKNDVEIEITFDPPWTPQLMDEEVRLELGIF